MTITNTIPTDDETENLAINTENKKSNKTNSEKQKFHNRLLNYFQNRSNQLSTGIKSENGNRNTTTMLANTNTIENTNYTPVPADDINSNIKRDQWTNKIEYMLSVIGYVVDLGNCVRFPYVTYKNGGGAFLIPYFIFLILIGTPMMYLEMAVGQYYRSGNITLWGKINPYMKGIGIASLLVVIYITLYYATIIAYAVFYFFASFRDTMPWSKCKNDWNTGACMEIGDEPSFINNTNLTIASPAEEYFYFYMLKINHSKGIDDLGPLKLDLVLCLIAVFALMYVCIYRGVKSTGKAVYITAVLPYIILIILLIRAVTLPGSGRGLYYFLKPTFRSLIKYQCWKDAAIQIFFTLGPGISVLTTYASYSKFHNNCQIDAISASIANVIASFLAGLVVFASLGHLSLHVNKDVEDVVAEGIGLSFIAYPDILSKIPGATFFSLSFFLMIINLGLDSCFGGLEAIYTALADEFPIIKMNRKISMAIIHIVLCLLSLPTVTYGGNYVVTFLDHYATSPALMLVVFAEAVTVTWIYGMDKFSLNMKSMMGFKPNLFWRICWQFITPLIIFILFLVTILLSENPSVGGYTYPSYFIALGWTINSSVMVPLVFYPLYWFIVNKVFNRKSLTQEITEPEHEV